MVFAPVCPGYTSPINHLGSSLQLSDGEKDFTPKCCRENVAFNEVIPGTLPVPGKEEKYGKGAKYHRKPLVQNFFFKCGLNYEPFLFYIDSKTLVKHYLDI